MSGGFAARPTHKLRLGEEKLNDKTIEAKKCHSEGKICFRNDGVKKIAKSKCFVEGISVRRESVTAASARLVTVV